MAYKILNNEVGVDIVVRLLTRKGDDPANHGEKIDVPMTAGERGKRVEYGKDGPFLNGVRIQSETNGHATFKRQMVTVRGSAWDDTLNTNDTLTISTTTKVDIKGSNS